jgi:hypothetical protein
VDKLFDLLPESLKNIIDSFPDNTNLLERYAIILKGYEKFNFSNQLYNYKFELESVLQDFLACILCKGECNTSMGKSGTRYYYNIDCNSTIFNLGKQLRFKMFECPGVIERQRTIKNQIISGIIKEAPKKVDQTISENFKKFKENLNRISESGKIMPHYECPICRILFSAKDDPALEKIINNGGNFKTVICPKCKRSSLKYIEK